MTTCSDFYDNKKKFVCRISKDRFHSRIGSVEFETDCFSVTVLDGTCPVTHECSEEEYSNKLAQFCTGRFIEKKYEYGHEFTNIEFTCREPFLDECFGEKSPNIKQAIKIFEKPKLDRDYLKRRYPCKGCSGEGTWERFSGYEKVFCGRKWRRYGIKETGFEWREDRIWRNVPDYETITCSKCGGRGYDIEAVMAELGQVEIY